MDLLERNLLYYLMLGMFLEKVEDGKWYWWGLMDEEIVVYINFLIGGGLGIFNVFIEFVIYMLVVNLEV